VYNFFHIKLWCREGKYKRAFLQHKINFVVPTGSGKTTARAKKFVFCYTRSIIVVLNYAVTC
jgi:flagellar biosynthesis GTPase FlhF